jgi:hypothetical protein
MSGWSGPGKNGRHQTDDKSIAPLAGVMIVFATHPIFEPRNFFSL